MCLFIEHVWVNTYVYTGTQSVMNWLCENQDETLSHEEKGGTLWFREETACEKKKQPTLKSYSHCLNITERSSDTMMRKTGKNL